MFRVEIKIKTSGYEWFRDFFKHFFEIFKEVCQKTREMISNFEESIAKVFHKIYSDLDEMKKSALIAAENYSGEPYPNNFKTSDIFKVGDKPLGDVHKEQFESLKARTRLKLQDISSQVDQSYKGSNWHLALIKINEIYTKKLQSYWTADKYFLDEKICVICGDRAHRINSSFPPGHELYYKRIEIDSETKQVKLI